MHLPDDDLDLNLGAGGLRAPSIIEPVDLMLGGRAAVDLLRIKSGLLTVFSVASMSLGVISIFRSSQPRPVACTSFLHVPACACLSVGSPPPTRLYWPHSS